MQLKVTRAKLEDTMGTFLNAHDEYTGRLVWWRFVDDYDGGTWLYDFTNERWESLDHGGHRFGEVKPDAINGCFNTKLI